MPSENKLPKISLRPSVPPQHFLSEAVRLDYVGHTIIKRSDYVGEDWQIVEIEKSPEGIHKGLRAQLTSAPCYKKQIHVCLVARRWHGMDLVDAKTYIEAARDLIAPFLKLYRSTFGKSCGLRVDQRIDPKMPKRTGYFFQGFLCHANKLILHWRDWERFYQFVWAAHIGRVSLSSADVEYLLTKAGFSKEYAAEIANIYHHGRELLTNRTRLNYVKWK
jgi:hypothetical protein